MKTRMSFFLMGTLLVMVGCKTTELETAKPISWKQQQAFLKRVDDPRIFGLGIYNTPSGPQIRGGGRLHPTRAEALPMLTEKEETLRPVVNLYGNFGVQWPVLLDCTASRSLLEFDIAQKIGARPVGEQNKAVLARLSGDEMTSCLALIPSLRLGQMFIENALVYVRLANGPLGLPAREIQDPQIRGIVGWDVLRKFEQVQFLYSVGQIILKTTESYEPNPGLLVASLPLVDRAGACVVRGTVDGRAEMILIDPAGDFEVATGTGGAVSRVQLDSGLEFSNPSVAASPGGVRIGARLLRNYLVTICPQAGVVYFEKQFPVEE